MSESFVISMMDDLREAARDNPDLTVNDDGEIELLPRFE